MTAAVKTLNNQVALVTGGSRGIGRSISVELARQGAKVFVNYSSSPAEAEKTVELCREAGGQAEAIGFNVTDSELVEQSINKIKETAGSIDILVNNAGVTYNGVFIRLKNEDWDKVMQINLSGAFYCSRTAAKHMMKARTGRIINISSVVAEMGNPGQAPYVASKAGLIGLTKSLAKELGVRNITVNAITPGFIETEMTAGLPEATKAEHFKAIPLGTYGAGEDIAHAVSFLASPHARYITGQVLGVNGGMYM